MEVRCLYAIGHGLPQEYAIYHHTLAVCVIGIIYAITYDGTTAEVLIFT